jgi:hypothetical protein
MLSYSFSTAIDLKLLDIISRTIASHYPTHSGLRALCILRNPRSLWMGVCAGWSDVGASTVACFSLILCITTSDFHASDQFQGRLRVPKWNDHRTCYSLVTFGSPQHDAHSPRASRHERIPSGRTRILKHLSSKGASSSRRLNIQSNNRKW